jgi:PAS domain S-box-containing protein
MSTPLNVLILEDSESDALLLLRELRRGGFEVNYLQVQTADAMIRALHEQDWDIILSDYSMPTFDGLTAVKLVQELGLDIPCIIISGTVGEDAAVAAMKAGASDFFAKGRLTRLVPAVERELREAEGRLKRIQAEAALRTSEEEFRLLAENSTDMISRHTPEGVYIYVSPACRTMLGYEPEDLIGISAYNFFHPDDIEPISQLHTALLELPESRTVVYRFRRKDDRYTWFETSSRTIRDAETNEVLEIHSSSRDVSKRKEAEQSLKHYAERLALLHKIDQAILMADRPQVIAHAVLEQLQALTGFDHASVTVFDEADREFKMIASIVPIPDYRPYEDISTIKLLEQNEIYVVEDLLVTDSLSPSDHALIAAGIRSYVRIPLFASGKLLGSFNLKALHPAAFSSQAIDIAREVGAQLAIAIENARLLEIEKHRTNELIGLHQVSLQLTSSLAVERILDIILDYAILLVNATNAHVFLYDGEKLTFGAAQWKGKKQYAPLAEPRPQGLTYKVAQSKERVVIPDVNQDPIYSDWTWGGAIIGLPLRVADDVNGVMSLAFAEPHYFNNHEIRVLELLSDQAAIAVHNAQLYQQIQNHAEELEQKVLQRTAELQASEAKYRALIEFAPDPIIIIDAEGMITLANKRAEESFGYLQDELMGQPIEILVPEHLRDLYKDHRASYTEPLTPHTMGTNLDLNAQRKNGTEFPVKIGLSPIQTETDTLIMAYIIDVTADKRLEASLRTALAKERELNELKTNFTSMVSHEFRTPLSVILYSSEMLITYNDRMDPERQLDKLKKISQQAKRLNRFTDDILTITRSESVGFEFNPTQLNVIALCKEIIEEVQVGYRNGVSIDFTHQADLGTVWIDAYLFTHILQNLASNAMKYSSGGSKVHVHLACSQGELTLEVKDAGIGIPQEHQGKLFESFRRATNVGQIPGTGVGLTIVKRAVDTYGGTIEFESIEGQGTTFIVKLPNTSGEAEAVTSKS